MRRFEYLTDITGRPWSPRIDSLVFTLLFLAFQAAATVGIFLAGLASSLTGRLAEIFLCYRFGAAHTRIAIKAGAVRVVFADTVAFFTFTKVAVGVFLAEVTRTGAFGDAVVFSKTFFAAAIGAVVIVITDADATAA